MCLRQTHTILEVSMFNKTVKNELPQNESRNYVCSKRQRKKRRSSFKICCKLIILTMFYCLTVILVPCLIITNTFAQKNSTDLVCYSDNFSKNLTCKGDNLATLCYYTSTILETTLTFNQEHMSPVYNMSCDFTGICDHYNATGAQENTFIQIPGDKDSTTHLYCCSTDNCNKPKQINKMCYNAYKAENISAGTKEKCTNSESHCTKMTAHVNGTEMQYFSCEQNLGNTAPCKTVTSHQAKCFNTSMQGTQVELCCCYGDLCLVPTFNFTEGHHTVDLNGTIWIEHYIKPQHTQKKKNTDWLFVGGLISAGVLVLLIVIAAIIAVKCRKKKKSDRMMLSYTRLAADSTPDDEEDVRMLLG